MEITLIIMAAGIGSRYKGGIKQLEAMDDQGRIIIDYSVYDAVEAGFNHIIFVIRREIEDDFRCISERGLSVCIANGASGSNTPFRNWKTFLRDTVSPLAVSDPGEPVRLFCPAGSLSAVPLR